MSTSVPSPQSIPINSRHEPIPERMSSANLCEREEPRFTPVLLRVNDVDIARMEYFLNEAGMCDWRTCNAISLAIRRELGISTDVKLRRRKGRLQALVCGSWCLLGERWSAWLDRVLAGWIPNPPDDVIWLPSLPGDQ